MFDLTRDWLKNEGTYGVYKRLMPCESSNTCSPRLLQFHLAGLRPGMDTLPGHC